MINIKIQEFKTILITKNHQEYLLNIEDRTFMTLYLLINATYMMKINTFSLNHDHFEKRNI